MLSSSLVKGTNTKEASKILRILNSNSNCHFEIDSTDLSVEHILSTDSSDYENTVSQIEKEIEDKTGNKFEFNPDALYNLTLLPKLPNSKLTNKKYADKVECYKKYNYFPTTGFISKYDKYTSDSLIEYKIFLWKLINLETLFALF